jgi:hypothetical protein
MSHAATTSRPLAAIDWPALLDELAIVLGEPDPVSGRQVPVSTVVLAESLGVARGTLRGWLDGSEPKHQDGERLLDRWCSLTGKARVFAPRDIRPLSATAR